MSRWHSDRTVCIALARSQVAYSWAECREEVRVFDVPASLGELAMDMSPDRVAALRAWLGDQQSALGLSGRRLQAVVTAELSRMWTLQPPTGLRSLRELREFASMRATQVFGEGARMWRLGADWRVDRHVTCWAIPEWLEEISGVAARAPRAQLADLIARYRAQLPREGWAAMVLADSLAIVRLQGGMCTLVRSVPLIGPRSTTLRSLAPELRRVMLRAAVREPFPEVNLIDAIGAERIVTENSDGIAFKRIEPGGRVEAVRASFALSDVAFGAWLCGPHGARRGTGRRAAIFRRTIAQAVFGTASSTTERFLAALAVMLMCGAAVVAAASAWQGINALDEAHLRLATLQKRALPAIQRPANSAIDHALAPAQRARLNVAIRQLNTPWGSLLDGLEAETPDTVVILAIESTGERSTVRLQAGAGDIDTPLHYAAGLPGRHGFIKTTLLQQESGGGSLAPARLTFDLALSSPEEGVQ